MSSARPGSPRPPTGRPPPGAGPGCRRSPPSCSPHSPRADRLLLPTACSFQLPPAAAGVCLLDAETPVSPGGLCLGGSEGLERGVMVVVGPVAAAVSPLLSRVCVLSM